MRKFFEKNLCYILILVAIVFVIIAISDFGKQLSYKETKAEITKIEVDYGSASDDTSYNVTVKYRAGGRAYEGLLGEYNAFMHEGDEISILYNPKNPGKIVKKGFLGITLELGFAVACGGFGISLSVKKRKETE